MKMDVFIEEANKLIDVANSIFIIYENIYDAIINKNEDKRQEYIDYLKIAVDTEQNIYERLNINDELNCSIFLNILHNKINSRDYDEGKKENITKRIENFLLDIAYGQPDLITDLEEDENLEENTARIFYRINYQYTSTLYSELDKTIKEMKSGPLIKEILYSKLNLIYTYKNIENRLLNHINIVVDDGKKKLLRNNYDINLVENIYHQFILDTFNASINLVLSITDNDLPDKYINQTLDLLTLKSCLKQLSKHDLLDLYNNFYNLFLANGIKHPYKVKSTNSIDGIKKVFKEILNEKDNIKIKKR